ncbi:ATP-dependent endonuclease [Herbiconiux sp. P15]|uniref:ATP-dependent nuclease n=1 Tax=Herbiconiux liukaitaii TaxID=3342799 RepID=UPI0035BB5EC5
MHITKISIAGFRGIDANVEVASPLSLIVGPNNAGKSSVIDAVRTVLQPFADGLGNRWIAPSDFTRVPEGTDHRDIEISIDFGGVQPQHRGRLISILAPSIAEGAARLSLHSRLGANGRPITRWHGGDLNDNEVESIAKEALRFIYLPALRDATADLRPGQNNRLANLVSTYAPPKHQDRDALVAIMAAANIELAQIPAILSSARAIQTRLTGVTGRGPYAHSSSLQFSDPRFERIVSSLQALAGGTDPSTLAENGLGYNNLVYVSVLLAVLETENDLALNVLLVEEPESHLHPQLQALLLQYLEQLSDTSTQVIATTHSPQFASSAKVERITVLRPKSLHSPTTANLLANAPLSPRSFSHLRRFLDVTKSMMLFSEAVILVEGVAELLLLPALAAREGISLAEQGATVVSVDGLAFDAFISVFESGGVPIRCAVISDSDSTLVEAPEEEDEDFVWQQSDTAAALRARASDNISIHLAAQTFEWDLALANFEQPDALLIALKRVKPRVGARIDTTEYASASAYADAVLDAVRDVKGRFAQELADVLDTRQDLQFVVPEYIKDALARAINRRFPGDVDGDSTDV